MASPSHTLPLSFFCLRTGGNELKSYKFSCNKKENFRYSVTNFQCYQRSRYREGYFAVLRVANEPTSTNTNNNINANTNTNTYTYTNTKIIPVLIPVLMPLSIQIPTSVPRPVAFHQNLKYLHLQIIVSMVTDKILFLFFKQWRKDFLNVMQNNCKTLTKTQKCEL